MPCTGTETTTTTNAMLNTPKLCRVSSLKHRPNDRNISMQDIATLHVGRISYSQYGPHGPQIRYISIKLYLERCEYLVKNVKFFLPSP